MHRTVIYNHLPNHEQLSNKSNLLKNLEAHCRKKGLSAHDYIPPTFNIDLSSPFLEKQLRDICHVFPQAAAGKTKSSPFCQLLSVLRPSPTDSKPISILANKFKSRKTDDCLNVWLLKPAGNNRGQGIQLLDSLSALDSLLAQQATPRRGKQFVLQKYIEKPLLIQNRKFDMRIWVLVNQDMNLYVYQEGYIRTSSSVYSLEKESLQDMFIHLTNTAIQKENTTYNQFEEANQLSYAMFQEVLSREHGCDPEFLQNTLLPRIYHIILLVFSSTSLNHSQPFCYELFGLDFMIDHVFNVSLLEVNTNPCLEQTGSLLSALIPQMVSQMFRTLFCSVYGGVACKKEGSLWELLTNIYRK